MPLRRIIGKEDGDLKGHIRVTERDALQEALAGDWSWSSRDALTSNNYADDHDGAIDEDLDGWEHPATDSPFDSHYRFGQK